MAVSVSVPSFADSSEITDYPAIVNIDGAVSVKSHGEPWAPAEIGMHVPELTIIKTPADSKCDITMDATMGNIISLGSETTLQIGATTQSVKVTSGRVFSLLSELPEGSSFQVETPTAIAGVRGTGWETQIGNKIAKFLVDNGIVVVTGVDKTGQESDQSDVPQGKSIAAGESGKLGDLKDLTKAEKEYLRGWAERLEWYKNKGICAVLTNCQFMNMLSRLLDVNFPEGFDEMISEEQFEIEANLLAELGISDFIGTSCGDIVTKGFAAEVLSKVIDVPDDLTTSDDKIAYFSNLGYISSGGAEDALTSCSARPIAEAYTPPITPTIPRRPPPKPEPPASKIF